MKRRTKKSYADLFDNPRAMFHNCELILYPNGSEEIWIQAGNHGFRIRANNGPAGLGLQIDRFVGGGPLSVSGNLSDGHETPAGVTDQSNVSITQYNDDEWSQKFKAWYAGTPDAPHPGDKPDGIPTLGQFKTANGQDA